VAVGNGLIWGVSFQMPVGEIRSVMPVGLELGAAGSLAELLVDVVPDRSPVFLHVVMRHLIGDALIAQTCHQPIEHDGGVAIADRRLDLVSLRSARMSSIKVAEPARPQTAWMIRTAWAIAAPAALAIFG
jgi:hypothetical protein